MSLIDQITMEDLDMLAKRIEARKAEPAVFEETEYHPEPEATKVRERPVTLMNVGELSRSQRKALVEKERAVGVQRALHVVMGAMLAASTEDPLPDLGGRYAPLDQHTIEALSALIQKRTGVEYDGSRSV